MMCFQQMKKLVNVMRVWFILCDRKIHKLDFLKRNIIWSFPAVSRVKVELVPPYLRLSFLLLYALFSSTAHTHITHTLLPPSTFSSPALLPLSGLYRHSAIWAEADKSSCAGLAVPAGLPGASEAWLSEAMGEICGSQGRNGMPLTCWSRHPRPCLSVSQLTWPCTGLNPHWEQRKLTRERTTLWSFS